LKDVLRSHHIVITGKDLYDNKFFDPSYRGEPMPREMREASFKDMLDEVSRYSTFKAYPGGSGYRCLRTPEEYERIRMKEQLERSKLYLDILLHDVNNINVVVKGYADILLERSSGEDRVILSRLIKNVDHNFAVIRNVSNLMMIQSDQETMTIDLDAVIRAEIAHFPESTITYSGTRSLTRADDMLVEVVHNLIGNAVKYGGQDVHVHVTVREEGDFHLLIVEDDGPGVSDDLKATVFDRMRRGRTTKSGKGLGLYIVKELVHCYGGEVGVEDRVPGSSEKGARFTVRLRKA
jgi:signal transduction histidine kinase